MLIKWSTNKTVSETKPAHDEVAKKAYAIYLKEGHPQGHAEQNWLEAETQLQHTGSGHPDRHGHHDHHAHMAADDKVLIKPGEKIPADGVIVAGESSVNEAMLTGESTPVARKTGGKVIGGSINGEGSLTIEVKVSPLQIFLGQFKSLIIWILIAAGVISGALARHAQQQRKTEPDEYAKPA